MARPNALRRNKPAVAIASVFAGIRANVLPGDCSITFENLRGGEQYDDSFSSFRQRASLSATDRHPSSRMTTDPRQRQPKMYGGSCRLFFALNSICGRGGEVEENDEKG